MEVVVHGVIMEVVVPATVVEVAVHEEVVELDGSVTRVFGDDCRTWFGVVLASSDLSVPILATVAVHVS